MQIFIQYNLISFRTV